ncbi:MAG: type II toxin-antitoxin system HicB family antitoxin [Methylococcales bacterium]
MRFFVAIEPGDANHAFGVMVPDLPGCFSAGDSLDEAFENAKQAIDLWCEAVIEDGGMIPPGKTLTELQADPDLHGWIWSIVDVPVERYLGPAEKVNITLPKLLLTRIDEYAKAHGATRSGFLAQAARQAMR